MKVTINHEYINEIPVLHVFEQSKENTCLPFILFIHGYTSAKEHNLHYAYLLAEKGFRVVLPDAQYHGERSQAISIKDLQFKFWDIVLHTIGEINTIKEHFVKREIVDEERIGVVGTSMGGIITLGALTQYSWIKAAVSLMGCPSYQKFVNTQVEYFKREGVSIPFNEEQLKEQLNRLQNCDLSLQKEKLANRPLLFWHGKKDSIVPFAPTFQFYEEIKSLYTENPELLHFEVDEHAGHKVSRKGVLLTVDWFEKHLQQKIRNTVHSSL
ncbi:alpha/beta fold hydrolase [Bacillus sp. FJAT-47783]|uniref:alpha/beta fold hydrolase n=1 Tax=Bacillus sp. FJAT-47783 TaxID=2922712 RepID=UPI001FAC91F6|nr:alpha/beta fold hydrolase [Bacillus sp. FJAT-47783]